MLSRSITPKLLISQSLGSIQKRREAVWGSLLPLFRPGSAIGIAAVKSSTLEARSGVEPPHHIQQNFYVLRRGSNGYENTSVTWNFLAWVLGGLKRKFTVSGTSALGTRSKTLSFFLSHAVPKRRVTSSRVRQSCGNPFVSREGTFISGPSIFSSVNSGGTSFALVWTQTSSKAEAGVSAR